MFFFLKKMGQNHLKRSFLDHIKADEVCIQIQKTYQQKVYRILSKLNIQLISTSELIPDQKDFIYVWILDTNNSIRNAVASGLFTTQSKIVIKSKGTHKIMQDNLMTALELKCEIDNFLKKGLVPISHSPLHYTGTKFIRV